MKYKNDPINKFLLRLIVGCMVFALIALVVYPFLPKPRALEYPPMAWAVIRSHQFNGDIENVTFGTMQYPKGIKDVKAGFEGESYIVYMLANDATDAHVKAEKLAKAELYLLNKGVLPWPIGVRKIFVAANEIIVGNIDSTKIARE